jgi:SWI/SNF-related matrix-associated actin-dependent regulator of chromatin subfamily A-like protein 1
MFARSLFDQPQTVTPATVESPVAAVPSSPKPLLELGDDDRLSMASVAISLAEIQMPKMDIDDGIGFANSDVMLGWSLGHAADGGYASKDELRYLAWMIGTKYRGQAAARIMPDALERIRAFGAERPERENVRYGVREPVSVKRAEGGGFLVEVEHKHAYYLQGLPVRREPSALTNLSRLVFTDASACQEFLNRVRASNERARIVGDQAAIDELQGATPFAIPVQVTPINDSSVRVDFDYDQTLVAAIRTVPGRRFDSTAKGWVIPTQYIAQAIDALERAGANAAALRELVPGGYRKPDDLRIKVALEITGETARFPGLPYDQTVVEGFRAIPSSRFDREKKSWSCSVYDIGDVQKIFRELAARYNAEELLAYELPEIPREAIVDIPEARIASLYKHQREGVELLVASLDPLRDSVPGGRTLRGMVLGDDMGLGKTAQVSIAADLLTTDAERILIVCPASLQRNWRKEIRMWVGPGEKIAFLTADKDLDSRARWLIGSYEMAIKKYDELRKLGFDILVMDEAHYIKNTKAMRSLHVVGGSIQRMNPLTKKKERIVYDGLCGIAKKRVYALTGTPMPNKMRDSYNLWKAIGHPVAANKHRFEERYCAGHWEQHGRDEHWVADGATNISELKAIVGTVFLQRKKEDVLSLPPKTREFVPVEINTAAYRKAMKKYADKDISDKIAIEMMTESRVATAAGKVPATVEFVENCVEQGEKVIIFSNFTTVLDEIEKKLESRCVRVDGGVSVDGKDKAVEAFQGDETVKVFLGQIIAAGTGLNLTAATRVVFNEMDWLPGNLKQAEDRAYRIGQSKHVTVSYIVAEGTVDEDLADALARKLRVSSEFEEVRDSLMDDLRKSFQQRVQQKSSPTLTL